MIRRDFCIGLWRVRIEIVALALVFLLLGMACSVKNNNATTRMYHNLTTRYNVYYNGNIQFNEAYLRLLEGQTESYTERIAFDPIAYLLASQTSGGGGIFGLFDQSLKKADKAIKEHSLRVKPERNVGWHKDPKQRAEQAKTEYNAVLHRAWMLRGQSQLYNGQLQEALATFDYITRLYNTQDEVRVPALLWQIKCLCLSKRSIEAKELFAQIDSTRFAKLPLYMGVRAEYHLAMEQISEAIDWLRRYVPYAKPLQQRMRLYYLLGQLYQSMGNRAQAFDAYKKVLTYSPAPSLEFAARLRCAELSLGGQRVVQTTLERMSEKQRYREHLDQIYYSLGKSYLLNLDTAQALRAFALSVDSSKTKGQDYTLALMAQGDIYMSNRKYVLAADKYQVALNSLSKEDKRYYSLEVISSGLEKLRPLAHKVTEGDSLLHLARSPESYRFQVIDSVIRSLKQQDTDQIRQKQRDSVAQVARELATRMPRATVGVENPSTSGTLSIAGDDTRFYFYNPKLIRQGGQAFEREWGKRPLADLWRFRQIPNLAEFTAEDSSVSDQAKLTDNLLQEIQYSNRDSIDEKYTRAYYLSQLPLSDEAQRLLESDIELAMLRMGEILTNDLELFLDAIDVYEALLERYPEGQGKEVALYNLYLLSLRSSLDAKAQGYLQRYLAFYPNTDKAKDMKKHSNYLERLISRGKEVQQIYQSAYDAYWRGDISEIKRAHKVLVEQAPQSEHDWRTRFLLAMSYAMQGDRLRFKQQLQTISTEAPEDISTLSRDMLAGIEAGKPIFSGRPRAIEKGEELPLSENNHEGLTYKLVSKGSKLKYIMLLEASLDINELVYQLSHFHYSEYTQGGITVNPLMLEENLRALLIGTFDTSSEALRYREVWERYFKGKGLLNRILLIPILDQNLQYITTRQSLIAYLQQMSSLQLGGLYSSELRKRGEQFLVGERSAFLLEHSGGEESEAVVLDFQINNSSGPQDTTLSIDQGEEQSRQKLEIQHEKLLGTIPLSYEEALSRQKDAERVRKNAIKEKERQRKAELKLRDRMQREALKEKEKLRQAKERERERQRKEREKLRNKSAKASK